MDIKTYIESGILELYVAGALSQKESQEVYEQLLKHPELLDEVLKIESSIVKLTSAVSPSDSKHLFEAVKESLGFNTDKSKVIPLNRTSNNRFSYVGWAASIVLAAGLIWMVNENNDLKSDIKIAETDKELLEFQIERANINLEESKKLVSILRDRNIIAVPLAGQPVYPEAYAKVYWDKNANSIYLDAQGLPPPPEGKVYQVWSLTLNPLSPTSLGIIDDFASDENKIFTIENANASEAFGITLEPAGGSASPTLEQLYTLGAVTSAP